MKYRVLCGCVGFALVVAMASAQTKVSSSGKCGKPDIQQSIPAGDKAGHVFALTQGKCVTMGEVGGVKIKEGMFSSMQTLWEAIVRPGASM